MKSPLNYMPLRITQKLSPRHNAVDIESCQADPFYAMEESFLLRNSWQNGLDGYGNHYTVLKGKESGNEYVYVHGRPIKENKNGILIKINTIIALTSPPYEGNSRGGHLHLRIVNREGKTINPLDLFDAHGIKYVIV